RATAPHAPSEFRQDPPQRAPHTTPAPTLHRHPPATRSTPAPSTPAHTSGSHQSDADRSAYTQTAIPSHPAPYSHQNSPAPDRLQSVPPAKNHPCHTKY